MVSRGSRGTPLNAYGNSTQLWAIWEIVTLRRLTMAFAAASALGISFCPADASARRTRAADADSVPSW